MIWDDRTIDCFCIFMTEILAHFKHDYKELDSNELD